MTDLLNQQSQPSQPERKTTSSFEIMMLPLEKLEPSKDNFYSIKEIDQLADSILNEGLHQNLVVVADGDIYKINTGHRRFAALKQLKEQGYEEYNQVPCLIKNYQNSIIQEMALINTNATARVLSDYEIMEQAARLQQLLKQAEEQGIEIKGKKRTAIAEILNTSESKIARLNSISNNLMPEFQEAFKEDKIGVSVATELAGLSEEEQAEIYENYENGETVSLNDVKEKKAKTRPENVLQPKVNESENTISGYNNPKKSITSTNENQVTLSDLETSNQDTENEPFTSDSSENSIEEKVEKLFRLITELENFESNLTGQEESLIEYLVQFEHEKANSLLDTGRRVIHRFWRLFHMQIEE